MIHFSNSYLTLSEMQDNAVYLYYWFSSRGWTDNAIAAMLGNMQTESTINGGIWESLDPSDPARGYGLVQWTPSTKYTSWLTAMGYSDTMDSQMLRIVYELDNNLQWIPLSSFGNMTFNEFKNSTLAPSYLADAFMKSYERPYDQNQPIRGLQANYWYEYLTGDIPPSPTPNVNNVIAMMLAGTIRNWL